MNLYGRFIRRAGNLRIQQVHTLKTLSYIFFPSQPFITGNKQGVARGFEIRGKLGERELERSLAGPQEVSRFSQKPGRALSVGSETKALTCTWPTRLVTIYLKLNFSNSSVSYQIHCQKCFDFRREMLNLSYCLGFSRPLLASINNQECALSCESANP